MVEMCTKSLYLSNARTICVDYLCSFLDFVFLIFAGPLTSMRHFKDEKQVITKDQECGLAFDKTDLDFQLGDTIVCYTMKNIKPKVNWNPPGF